jgi:hypothetical protein
MNENFKELLHLYYLENITNNKKQDKEGWYLITDLDESSSKFVVGGNKESFKEFYKDLLDLGLIIKSEDSKKIKFTEKYKVYGDFIHTKRTREVIQGRIKELLGWNNYFNLYNCKYWI